MQDNTHYQVIVLGSGPGGYIAALKAAQMGARTAVVELHPFFGGTCLNWGCIPSKALLASAELKHKIEHASDMGIEVPGEVSVNWDKIQKRKDRVLRGLRGGIKSLFAARKVTPYQGRGVLEAPGKVAITEADGTVNETITGDHVILAVGSLPIRFPGWPEDPEFVCTSDDSLHWKELPKSLLIVGGGVIGCEFACMMQPFGVDVTVVELMPKLLGPMDGALADAILKTFRQRGIKVHLETKVEDVRIVGEGVEAALSNGEKLKVEKVLVAAGRRPNTANLGLEKVGLSTGKGGFIEVNARMQTQAKGIYAIGDANGKCLLAHAASAHGLVAVENALGHERDFNAPIPFCVYTFPEIAGVGLTEEMAREKGVPFSVGLFPIGHLGKAMAVGETDGFVKVLKHRETGELLGVHMLGHNVTEVIASAGALLHQHVGVRDVADMVFAHPTISEAIHEAAEDALGMAMHLPPRQIMRVAAGV